MIEWLNDWIIEGYIDWVNKKWMNGGIAEWLISGWMFQWINDCEV